MKAALVFAAFVVAACGPLSHAVRRVEPDASDDTPAIVVDAVPVPPDADAFVAPTDDAPIILLVADAGPEPIVDADADVLALPDTPDAPDAPDVSDPPDAFTPEPVAAYGRCNATTLPCGDPAHRCVGSTGVGTPTPVCRPACRVATDCPPAPGPPGNAPECRSEGCALRCHPSTGCPYPLRCRSDTPTSEFGQCD